MSKLVNDNKTEPPSAQRRLFPNLTSILRLLFKATMKVLPTLAQRRPNHHQKRQADNEGTEPPSAQRLLHSILKPIPRISFNSYIKSTAVHQINL